MLKLVLSSGNVILVNGEVSLMDYLEAHRQKEGQEDQGGVKELGGTPLAVLRFSGPPGFPSGPWLTANPSSCPNPSSFPCVEACFDMMVNFFLGEALSRPVGSWALKVPVGGGAGSAPPPHTTPWRWRHWRHRQGPGSEENFGCYMGLL